ncbi:hypothetical protein SEVIR_9G316601v4 [Setaria viridis]
MTVTIRFLPRSISLDASVRSSPHTLPSLCAPPSVARRRRSSSTTLGRRSASRRPGAPGRPPHPVPGRPPPDTHRPRPPPRRPRSPAAGQPSAALGRQSASRPRSPVHLLPTPVASPSPPAAHHTPPPGRPPHPAARRPQLPAAGQPSAAPCSSIHLVSRTPCSTESWASITSGKKCTGGRRAKKNQGHLDKSIRTGHSSSLCNDNGEKNHATLQKKCHIVERIHTECFILKFHTVTCG